MVTSVFERIVNKIGGNPWIAQNILFSSYGSRVFFFKMLLETAFSILFRMWELFVTLLVDRNICKNVWNSCKTEIIAYR